MLIFVRLNVCLFCSKKVGAGTASRFYLEYVLESHENDAATTVVSM
jgi:hypothetical protein